MKKADNLHLLCVASLSCIARRNQTLGETPAEIHHIRTGQGTSQRANHQTSIPLCHTHHRNGGYGVAINAGRKQWEKNFGTELQLLEQVQLELGASYA